MYKVFGYNVDWDGYTDYSYTFNSFIEAVKAFKKLSKDIGDCFFQRGNDPTSCMFMSQCKIY